MIELRDNPKAPAAVRLAASQALLDRGYGKDEQHVSTETVTRNVIRAPEVVDPNAPDADEQWERKVEAYKKSQELPIPAPGTDTKN
jgi:hypothetical protein